MATRLGDVSVRALVPRDDPVGPLAAALLSRACGPDLVGAIDVAAVALHILDPGAYWVIRDLEVQVSVPVSETDPRAQARRIAAALVGAIERSVRRGPNGDVVRFAGAAEYSAAFVRARLGGASGTWVFDRVAGLRGLCPAAALVAVAAALSVDPLQVFARFAAAGGVERLLATASDAELIGLDEALGGSADTTPVPRRLLELARNVAATVPAASAGRWIVPAARRLDLLGRLIVTVGSSPGLLTAVRRVVASRPPEQIEPTVRPGRLDPTSPDAVETSKAPMRGPVSPDAPWSFAAAGAVAFMLLPDLSMNC